MRTRVLVGCLASLVLALATSCTKADGGGGVASVTGSAAPSPTPSLTQMEQAIRYTQCMREHGVPMRDPDANGDVRGADVSKGSIDTATVTAAQQACNRYQPVGDPELEAQRLERAREYSRCMRRSGVDDFPDPDAEGRVQLPDEITDPDYDDAKATCEAYVRSYTPHP
jgi:hypothetical protein